MSAVILPRMLMAVMASLPLWCSANLGSAVEQKVFPESAIENIRIMIKADRLSDASREIAHQLKQLPRSSELQFLQCVVHAHQQRVPQAVGCFSALVKAHPDMVEAYNNLGVLHASLGHHEEAKQWFDNGLRRVPALWTVHQNILSLQADLSRKAYSRALQIESPARETQVRLSFLATPSSVVSTSISFQEGKTVSLASRKSSEQVTSNAPSDNVRLVTPPANHAQNSASDTGNVLTAKPALPEPAGKQAANDSTQAQVHKAMAAWAKAWSEKNLPAYFDAYVSDFTMGKDVPHASWRAERTARISSRQFIRVATSNVTFEISNAKITARFNQTYESDNLQSNNRKRLDFVLEDGRWKIARETVIVTTP